jgi:hypothetical protein
VQTVPLKPGDSELPLNFLTAKKRKTTEPFAARSAWFKIYRPAKRTSQESYSTPHIPVTLRSQLDSSAPCERTLAADDPVLSAENIIVF